MKKNIVLLFLLFSIYASAQENGKYANGWREGWKEGYCFESKPNGGACTATAPIAPNPSDFMATYTNGYNDGFVEGKRYFSQKSKKTASKSTSIFEGYEIDFDNSLQQTISEIRAKETEELQKSNGHIGSSNNANISAQTQRKIAEVTSAYNKRKMNSKSEEDRSDSRSQIDSENARRSSQQSSLQELKLKQEQSRNNYNQQIGNTFTSASNSLQNMAQAMMMRSVQEELARRQKVVNNFSSEHSNKINKLSNLYSQIPQKNFAKSLNGWQNANLFSQKKYSFSNNQEFVTATSCLVYVENNIIKEIYLYGKKNFKMDYPEKFPENSVISNGIVKYTDFETLETSTIVLIEPYVISKSKVSELSETGSGFLTIWSSNKKDEGKIIYIQELDNKGNILREVSKEIMYAKNSKDVAQNSNVAKTAFNTSNNFLFFGEVTSTPFGDLPLFPKTSKDNNKPLSDNEHRFVEIKKYRE